MKKLNKPRNRSNNLIKQYRKAPAKLYRVSKDLWQLAYYLHNVKEGFTYRNDVKCQHERYSAFMKRSNRESIRRYIKKIRELGIYEDFAKK